MLKSSSCDYNDVYILFKGIITDSKTDVADASANNSNRKVIFKHFAPFEKCVTVINNTQVDNAQDIDVVLEMYNFLEDSDNYVKTSASLYHCCKDKPALYNIGAIVEFTSDNTIESFKSKEKIDHPGRSRWQKQVLK